MDSGSPRPGKTVLVHGLLGITLKECDHIPRRNPSRGRVENTYFVPVGQQQCDKSQDLFLLAPGRDLSGVYPGSKRTVVHRILQARILEWVAFPFSRGSSQPRDRTSVSHIAGGFFTSWATRKPSKRTPHSNDPFWTFPSPPRHTVCRPEGCHHSASSQSPLIVTSHGNSSFPKPQTTLALAPTLQCSFWSPTTSPHVAMFCVVRGHLSIYLLWLRFLDHRSRCGGVLLLPVSPLLTQGLPQSTASM